jgi:excisionase family DNA binding protein
MANKRYVSVKEFSVYTSLAESTLYEWSGTGRIPSIKMGKRILFDLEDMDKIMASMKRNNNQEERITNKILGDSNGN